MVPKKYTSQAVILSRRNYAETDRILTVFSRNYGKLFLLAKGVRNIKSRKRGHLEVFNLISFSATQGREMGLVTEVEIVESFSKLRKNLKKAAVAYFLVDVVRRVTREGEASEVVFEKLVDYLRKLEKTTKLKTLRENFTREMLVTLGFWPKDKRLVDTDQALQEVVEYELNSIRVGKKIAR